MKVIKRNGMEVLFDRTKIEAALASASADVKEDSLTRVELEQMNPTGFQISRESSFVKPAAGRWATRSAVEFLPARGTAGIQLK